jgi:septal ring factor EnvC (AmiA/AmiB activator)
MVIDEKILQEEYATLKADFDKTKKQMESVEKDLVTMRNNLNALYGALQQTEKLLKLSKEKKDGKKV